MPRLTNHKHTAESSAKHRKKLREAKVDGIRAANNAVVHREGMERQERYQQELKK